jgi:Epoxide hydrolase N terminus
MRSYVRLESAAKSGRRLSLGQDCEGAAGKRAAPLSHLAVGPSLDRLRHEEQDRDRPGAALATRGAGRDPGPFAQAPAGAGPCLASRPENTLDVPDGAVEDLRQRLSRTRCPDQMPGPAWACGTDVADLREFVRYWREAFDWRAAELRLNASPQYQVPLDGIDLTSWMYRARGRAYLHSCYCTAGRARRSSFLDLIRRLCDPARFGGDPADAFAIVAPSLPGFGLSLAPGQPRFSAGLSP